MNFKPVPFGLEILYRSAYLAVFRKLKERMGFDRMRMAYSGAAPIAPDILLFFQSIGVNLIEGYGQTEGTGVTTLSRIGRVQFGTGGAAVDGCPRENRPGRGDPGQIPGRFQGVFRESRRPPPKPSKTAGCIPATWGSSTRKGF